MDDHDLLIRIDERMENIEKKVDEIRTNCTARTTKMTRDIEGLRSWKNKMAGAIALLGAAVGFVFYLLVEIGKKLFGWN